ncbi:hypothetical protein MFLAVUS_003514 [Mucor flavus]|uniref:Retrotransposon gag domain-containing protein n=1 Tax=Mucor flavus TaxID=439312 RepID=A0ABP9YTE9_9FUNG
MSSNPIERSIQQELDAYSEAFKASLDNFTKWLKSERRSSTPPPSLNHEDPFSPSSDECASIGSPVLSGNDGHNIVSIDNVMFTQPKTDTHRSQDLYKTKDKENNNNNQILFPAFNSNNNNTDDAWTSHCNTTVRSYKLPEITFTGCILKSTLEKTQLRVPEIITEGLLVNKFLDEFESHIKQTNLNIEEHWYGLLEITFKGVRDRHIGLYVWFKKRLYEGLPWSSAKAIMKHQLGFESCNSKKTIKEALASYRQGVRESFDVFFNRFQSYVVACKALSLYPDHVLIYHFIFNVHTEVYNYIKECLHKQFELKARARTLPFPEEEYNSLSLGERDEINTLSRVPSSWEEFDTTIIFVNLRKLCLISQDATKRIVSQIYHRRVNREKKQERKGQSHRGGTKKIKTFA